MCHVVPAAADTSLHGTGTVGVGYNDNIQGGPDDPPEGTQGPISDITVSVAPALLLLHMERSWQASVRYQRSYAFFVDNQDVDGCADQVDAGATISLTPVDEMTWSLGVTRTNSNLSLLGNAQDSTTQAQPVGDIHILRVGLGETLDHGFSDNLSLSQTAAAAVTTPLSSESTEAGTLVFDGGVGPRWAVHREHELSGQIGAQYTHGFSRDNADGSSVAAFDQVAPRALARWRFQFAQDWATELSGGIAIPFDPDVGVDVVPLAGAGLFYAFEEYFASLEYTRAVTTNVTTGQAFHSDTAMLNAAVPLWLQGGLTLAGSAGFARNRLVDASLDGESIAVNNVVGDVSLNWAMPQTPLTVSARYQYLKQFDAPDGQTRLFDFTRNAATLTIGWFLPSRDRRRFPLVQPRRQ